MSAIRTYEYARLWVPLYDPAALTVNRPVYLLEAADGFEGFAAEKNTTLIGVLNEFGRDGWRIETAPFRVSTPSAEFQLLVDATLDEFDGGSGESTPVHAFDVYGMRRSVG